MLAALWLLAELTVTRHLTPTGEVCVFVGGIDPTTDAIQVQPAVVPPPWTLDIAVPAERPANWCVPISLQRLGQPWYHVRECTAGPPSCGPWTHEVRLACFGDVPNGGCEPLIYHEEN